MAPPIRNFDDEQFHSLECAHRGTSRSASWHARSCLDNAYPLYVETSNTNKPSSERWWFNQLEIEGLGIPRPPTNFWTRGVWRCPTAQWPGLTETEELSYGYNAFGDLPVGNLTNNLGLEGHYSESATHLVAYAPIAERKTYFVLSGSRAQADSKNTQSFLQKDGQGGKRRNKSAFVLWKKPVLANGL
jgi:hypothetical protein